MWDIWGFVIPSRRWSHWSYYLCRYGRVGRHNKEVNLLKLYGYGELSFSYLWHWSYLIMFSQQGRLCESWREYIPKKAQRHSKSCWYFWIWYCWIFLEMKGYILLHSGLRHITFLGYQSNCASFPHKAFAHQKDTRVTSYLVFMMSMMVMCSLIWRSTIQFGRRQNLLREFTSSMTQRTTFQLMKLLFLTI